MVVLRHPDGAGRSETLDSTRSGSSFDAGTVNLTTGALDIAVVIHRSGLADTTVKVPWRVKAPEVKRAPVVISSQPLAPSVDVAALLVALAVLGVLLFGIFASRRDGHSEAGRPWAGGWYRAAARRFRHLFQGWRGSGC